MATSSTPSFFKVLRNPFAENLPLPHAFVSSHLMNKIPKDPIIRSENGDYVWRLKIIKAGEYYCFAHGWKNVVDDLKLGVADILVFRLVDESTFTMAICGLNGCEKKVEGDPFFMTIISKSHKGKLALPVNFVVLAGIKGEGTLLTMKNLDGEERQMELRLDKSYYSERYYLSCGWHNFRQSNNLSQGDICLFKFIKNEGTLCLARVTKKRSEAATPPLPPPLPPLPPPDEIPTTEVAKRPRGRPRKHPHGSSIV